MYVYKIVIDLGNGYVCMSIRSSFINPNNI